MRFDTVIKFYDSKRVYNPDMSRYEGGLVCVKSMLANVTDIGVTRSVKLFGKIDTQSKVIRLMHDINFKWSYLTIGDDEQHYMQLTKRDPLLNHTLIVGVVNNGNNQN